MNTPAPVQPASARPRVVRAVGLALLALSLGFLGLLASAATLPVIRESVRSPDPGRPGYGVALGCTLLAAIFGPVILLVACNRLGWLRRPQLALLWTLVFAAGAYLAWDDPVVRRPLTMEELSPALPGDEASFRTVLRYATNLPADQAVKPLKPNFVVATGDLAANPEKWIRFLRDHRAEIETEWAALAPVRAWWDELAARPRIGDLTAANPAAPIVAFQPVRFHAQLAVAIASLQALDGHGDAAMAAVIRLYDVARKLEPNSRTLLRSMIAKVIQKMALQAAGFVLDHAAVSPAARAAFAAEVSAAAGGPAGAKRLMLIEYAFFQPTVSLFLGDTPVGDSATEKNLWRATRIFGRLIINPRATQNLVGDRYYALAELAAARRLGELEAGQAPLNRAFLAGYHVKNLGGRLLADLSMPAYSKVVKTYWEIEDLRLALLGRLRA